MRTQLKVNDDPLTGPALGLPEPALLARQPVRRLDRQPQCRQPVIPTRQPRAHRSHLPGQQFPAASAPGRQYFVRWHARGRADIEKEGPHVQSACNQHVSSRLRRWSRHSRGRRGSGMRPRRRQGRRGSKLPRRGPRAHRRGAGERNHRGRRHHHRCRRLRTLPWRTLCRAWRGLQAVHRQLVPLPARRLLPRHRHEDPARLRNHRLHSRKPWPAHEAGGYVRLLFRRPDQVEQVDSEQHRGNGLAHREGGGRWSKSCS